MQEERLLDQIMLSLRLQDGLSLQQLQAEYGQAVVQSLLPAFQRFLGNGLMQLTTETMHSYPRSSHSSRNSSSSSSSSSFGTTSTSWVDGQDHRRSSSSNHTAGGSDLNPDEAIALLQDRLLAGGPCGVRLNDPAGFLLSNDIISDLFAELEPATLSAATR